VAATEELRSRALALYDPTQQPDESLLHVPHAIEPETAADRLERGDIPEAHVIDSQAACANRKTV
jgi:hypothetical protein